MIQRKIDQLGEDDRRLLVAASVQGYEFDSAVVARVLERDAAEVEDRLDELDRVHALVRTVREQEFPDRTLTLRYRFVHVLYQNALYASLRPTRRASLSAAVAQALQGYYGEKSGDVAAELALLLEAARDFSRAADYFLVAAQNAVRVFANQEAVVLACRGVELLASLPDTPERARKELALQITLGPALFSTRDWTAPDIEAVYTRAHVLCRELGESPALFPALWGICLFRIVRGEIQTGLNLAEQLLDLAQARRTRASFCRRTTRWDGPMPSSEIGRPQRHTWSRRSPAMTAVSTARMPFSMAAMTRACPPWAMRPTHFGCSAIPSRPCRGAGRPWCWPASWVIPPAWATRSIWSQSSINTAGM